MPEVIINGPEGRLEGRYQHAKGSNAPIALLLHPHPQHGGTMNNKVTYAMYQTFVKMGFSTLRFNCESAITGHCNSFANIFNPREISPISVARLSPLLLLVLPLINCK